MINKLTIKLANKHNVLQVKNIKTHDAFHIQGLRSFMLHLIVGHLKQDENNSKNLYLIKFSDKQFNENQVWLKRNENNQYDIVNTYNGVEYFLSNPVFPSFFLKYFEKWPENIFLSIEITHTPAYLI